MKIGFAWPHTHPYYHRIFTERMFCMRRPVAAEYQLLTPNSDGPIDCIRNELCQQALITNCTHVFWADTDQGYPDDTLVKLLAHELPIVCAKVHRRKAPYEPLLKRWNPDKSDPEKPYVDVEDSEWAFNLKDDPLWPLVEVDATGFGCNLMAIEVIEKMERPWFQFDLYTRPTVGEDIYFWRKARAMGYKVYVDVSIEVGHIGQTLINKETYFAYKRSLSMG